MSESETLLSAETDLKHPNGESIPLENLSDRKHIPGLTEHGQDCKDHVNLDSNVTSPLVKYSTSAQSERGLGDEANVGAQSEEGNGEVLEAQISDTAVKAKRRHRQNMFFLCAGFLFNYVAFQAEQNLQSSLNSTGGSGVMSLAILYGALAISALFLAPAALRSIGPRTCLLLAVIAFGLFTVANILGDFYLLLISAGLVGLSAGVLWPSQFKILTNTASAYAKLVGKRRDEMITLFNGIFFTVFVSTHIPGNLTSSLLLSEHDAKTEGHCAPSSDTTVLVSTSQRRALMIVFVVCDAISFIMFFCMRPCGHRGWTDTETLAKGSVMTLMKQSALATLSLLRQVDMLLLVPINIAVGFVKAFLFSDYNQYFVSQCLGIGQIGFVMVCFGVSSAIGNISLSKIAQRTGRPVIVIAGTFMMIGLQMFLLTWERKPDVAVLFLLSALWGVTDSCFNQQLSALFGVVFRGLDQESSYANFALSQAAGFSLSFAYSRRFHGCLRGLRIKMALIIAFLPIAVALYLVVEWRVRRRRTYKLNVDGTNSNR